MDYRKKTIFIASICLISACATSPVADKVNLDVTTHASAKFSPIAHAHTIELLDFIAMYPDLPTETQRGIFKEVSQALVDDHNDPKLHIQQGAMLALPNSDVRDSIIAQQLLQKLLDNKVLNESDTSLVKLLLTFVHDQNKQQSKAREETKKNEDLKQKNKALVQQLNDLKNIEKTMIERNTKANPNP
jgi:hypothetical protein